MAPFRELLKPTNKFNWTPDLQEAFVNSKEEIIRLVKDGVKMSDPDLNPCYGMSLNEYNYTDI